MKIKHSIKEILWMATGAVIMLSELCSLRGIIKQSRIPPNKLY